MLLNPCPFQTSQFTVSKEHKSFVSEASDLGFRAGQAPGAQLYDDACDVGVTLINPRTGVCTHWYQGDVLKNEGDIMVWIFRPASETLRRHPALQGWEVHILND